MAVFIKQLKIWSQILRRFGFDVEADEPEGINNKESEGLSKDKNCKNAADRKSLCKDTSDKEVISPHNVDLDILPMLRDEVHPVTEEEAAF